METCPSSRVCKSSTRQTEQERIETRDDFGPGDATSLLEIDTADNYYHALRTLIDSKIKGRKVVEFEEVEEVPAT